MTTDGFRELAVALPDVEEGSHMDHPDFRIRGRIFASLPPPTALGKANGEQIGMVKLTPVQQRALTAARPEAFVPAAGAWGAQGCTYVRLRKVDRGTLRRAIEAAWRNTAPKRLAAELGPPDESLC